MYRFDYLCNAITREGIFLIGPFGVALLPFMRCHLPKHKRVLGLSPLPLKQY